MTPSRLPRAVPRLALTPDEAAAALGMGRTSFDEYVRPHVRVIREGKHRLYPVRDLEGWVERAAQPVLPGEAR